MFSYIFNLIRSNIGTVVIAGFLATISTIVSTQLTYYFIKERSIKKVIDELILTSIILNQMKLNLVSPSGDKLPKFSINELRLIHEYYSIAQKRMKQIEDDGVQTDKISREIEIENQSAKLIATISILHYFDKIDKANEKLDTVCMFLSHIFISKKVPSWI